MPGSQIISTKLLFPSIYPAVFVGSEFLSWPHFMVRYKPPRFVAEQCLRRLVIGGESGQVCVVFFVSLTHRMYDVWYIYIWHRFMMNVR